MTSEPYKPRELTASSQINSHYSTSPEGKRRDKLEIIAEMLEISKEDVLKTQLMYRANLSFTQLNNYLRFLLKINLLGKVLVEDKDRYKTTAKGLDFLQRYSEITELLKSDEDKEKSIKTSVGLDGKTRTTLQRS